MIVDVWAKLEPIFATWVDNLYPAVIVNGLDIQTQRYILQYLCTNLRDVGAQLDDMETGDPIYPRTVDEMINKLVADDVDGMVWVETDVEGLTLPQIGFFAPSDKTLSIHYLSGRWTPVALIGFLELLRWINDLGDHIHLEMETGTAPESWCRLFNITWQAYLADKG